MYGHREVVSPGPAVHSGAMTARSGPARRLRDLVPPVSGEDHQAWVVMVGATLLLLLFSYWGRPGSLRLEPLRAIADWVFAPFRTDYPGTVPYLYWGLSSLVFRVGAPLLIIVVVLRQAPREWGFRIRGVAPHLPLYALLYVVMIPLIIWASSFGSFQAQYPFYEDAVRGGLHFWLYAAGYWVQFLGVEAFFRGFLTFGLFPRFGWNAVVIMTIPYVMIHFPKPMPEAFAAIFAGLILGTLALRSRSFVPGVFVHVAVAVTMDFAAMSRELGSVGEALRAVF